jgi:hypothetical protein
MGRRRPAFRVESPYQPRRVSPARFRRSQLWRSLGSSIAGSPSPPKRAAPRAPRSGALPQIYMDGDSTGEATPSLCCAAGDLPTHGAKYPAGNRPQTGVDDAAAEGAWRVDEIDVAATRRSRNAAGSTGWPDGNRVHRLTSGPNQAMAGSRPMTRTSVCSGPHSGFDLWLDGVSGQNRRVVVATRRGA